LSLVLKGMDEGFNTNAESRSVVIHGADYVCEEFIKSNGRLGRSYGCPAVPVETHKQIIELMQGGSLLYIHASSSNYNSTFLDEQKAVSRFVKERAH